MYSLATRSWCLLFIGLQLVFPACISAQEFTSNTNPSFEITGGRGSGLLDIKRIDLAFENGFPQMTVNPGDSISATAIISFSGNGLFRAAWKVGEQIVEQVNIPVTFGSRLRLPLNSSTILPTLIPGEHILKLEVQSPATLMVPRVHYFVVPDSQKKAILHTRPIGSSTWQQRPLHINADSKVELDIPRELLVSPGIEYYVEVISADGKSTTDPVDEPFLKPYHVKVEGASSDVKFFLRGQTTNRPPNAAIIISRDKSHKAQFKPSSVRVMLDDMDVTGLLEIEGDDLVIKPPVALPGGQHSLIVSAEKENEEVTLAEFSFSVAHDKERPKTLYAKGNIVFQYGVNTASDGPSNRATGNAALAFGGSLGATDYSWNGININYGRNTESPWDLAAGFTFTASNDNRHFEYGDISISESPLTVSGFSRRGLKARISEQDSRMQFFVVGAEQVDGFNSGLSTDSNNQVLGASYALDSIGGGPFKLKVITVMGENAAEFGSNVAGSANPSKGETIGVQLESSFGNTWIGLDSGFSSFDANTLDANNADTDVALGLQARHDFEALQLSASLLRYGNDYATIANPNFTGDRQGGSLGLASTLGPAAFNVQLSRTEDNLDGDTTRPVVSSDAINTTLSLAWPNKPRLHFGLSQSLQNSRHEPSAQDRVKNSNLSFSAGLTHGGKGWRSALNTTFGKLDDRLSSNDDSTTRSITLSAGLNNAKGNLSASISQSLSESADVENESNMLGLNGSAILIPDELTLSANLNIQNTSASDSSLDNKGNNAALVLRYRGGELLRRFRKSLGGSAELSLSVDYRDQQNAVAVTESDDSVVFLSFTVGAPLNFHRDW
mgnify:FL=1